jgi:hypothetical protein
MKTIKRRQQECISYRYQVLWIVLCPHGLTSHQSPIFYTFTGPKNRFLRTNSDRLCSLAGRYDNPIPTRFLTPIDCLKILALCSVCMKNMASNVEKRKEIKIFSINNVDLIGCLFRKIIIKF